MNIRLAVDSDLDTILDIWLEGLDASFPAGSFEASNIREKFCANFRTRHGIFNYWVAEDVDRILGWQSLSLATVNPMKDAHFAESSTYIRKDARASRVAERLLSYVIDRASVTLLLTLRKTMLPSGGSLLLPDGQKSERCRLTRAEPQTNQNCLS